jgi:hypothetical protein
VRRSTTNSSSRNDRGGKDELEEEDEGVLVISSGLKRGKERRVPLFQRICVIDASLKRVCVIDVNF